MKKVLCLTAAMQSSVAPSLLGCSFRAVAVSQACREAIIPQYSTSVVSVAGGRQVTLVMRSQDNNLQSVAWCSASNSV